MLAFYSYSGKEQSSCWAGPNMQDHAPHSLQPSPPPAAAKLVGDAQHMQGSTIICRAAIAATWLAARLATAAQAEQGAACPPAACPDEQPHCNMSPAAQAEAWQAVACCPAARAGEHSDTQGDAACTTWTYLILCCRVAAKGGQSSRSMSRRPHYLACNQRTVDAKVPPACFFNCNCCCCRSAARSGQPSGSMCRATSSPIGPPKWRRRTTS